MDRAYVGRVEPPVEAPHIYESYVRDCILYRFTEGPFYGRTIIEVPIWYLSQLCAGGENCLMWKDEALNIELNKFGWYKVDWNLLRTSSRAPPKIADGELVNQLNGRSKEQRGRDILGADGAFIDESHHEPMPHPVRLPSLKTVLMPPPPLPASKERFSATNIAQKNIDPLNHASFPQNPILRSTYGLNPGAPSSETGTFFLLSASQCREAASRGPKVPLQDLYYHNPAQMSRQVDAEMRRKLRGFRHGVIENFRQH